MEERPMLSLKTLLSLAASLALLIGGNAAIDAATNADGGITANVDDAAVNAGLFANVSAGANVSAADAVAANASTDAGATTTVTVEDETADQASADAQAEFDLGAFFGVHSDEGDTSTDANGNAGLSAEAALGGN
jgi:hypothetical protein